MSLTFKVVPSLNCVEPGQAYFKELEAAANLAANLVEPKEADAWALCEYLDLVDAGNLQMQLQQYRACTRALGEYLCDPVNARHAVFIANKSWAAETLASVLTAKPIKEQPLRVA